MQRPPWKSVTEPLAWKQAQKEAYEKALVIFRQWDKDTDPHDARLLRENNHDILDWLQAQIKELDDA